MRIITLNFVSTGIVVSKGFHFPCSYTGLYSFLCPCDIFLALILMIQLSNYEEKLKKQQPKISLRSNARVAIFIWIFGLINNQIVMKKYTINYNRFVPQHRVPYDFHAYNNYKKQPFSDFLRVFVWKNAFYHQWTNQLPVYMCLCSLVVFTVWGAYKTHKVSFDDAMISKKSHPALKYVIYQTSDKYGDMGPYDSLLFKFKNEPLGQKDLGFDQ